LAIDLGNNMTMTAPEKYLCEVGYARAAWHWPTNPEQQHARDRWLIGLLVAVTSCLAVITVLGLNHSFGPHATTAHIERIATRLDRMTTIHPNTANAIMRIVGQPGYDCDRVACDAQLAARNSAAHARLATALAAKTDKIQLAVQPMPVDGFAAHLKSRLD
jgi:polysaccharide pyruvyl transferase WcaK-like protein